MPTANHVAFLDGVTGYLGRWTLFWFLKELRNERVAVLIRPSKGGAAAQMDVEARLLSVLEAIGMSSERHRVTVIAGDLRAPYLGNAAALMELRADTWLHIAGDVTFKKLGDRSSQTVNCDYLVNFVETARRTRSVPRTLCHTSTFYVYERSGSSNQCYVVPEAFHDPATMAHHNAYGYSKLAAEAVLREYLDQRALPFQLLVYRPDIVMHHIPVPEVAQHNPGLITDDFKVIYQLIAALIGRTKVRVPAGPSLSAPLPYVPCDLDTTLYMSDVDSIARAMMHLAVLYGDGAERTEDGYTIFHLVNRWRPLRCANLRELCLSIAPEAAIRVQHIAPEEFQRTILPTLPWLEQVYYAQFIAPFTGYMNRPRTEAVTANVDTLLGADWHNLHPAHGLDLTTWMLAGARQALEKDFGHPQGVRK